jgi:hypothetical protein
LTNAGSQLFSCAAWAITQLPLGGIALLPFSPGSVDTDGLQPNCNLVLWPYTRWDDPRLHLSTLGSLLHGTAMQTACKIGSFDRLGWLGYFYKDVFFCKRFEVLEDSLHVDLHCNAELYVKDRFLEFESLSPVATLEPGASLTHLEQWQVYRLTQPLDPSATAESLFTLAHTLLSTTL